MKNVAKNKQVLRAMACDVERRSRRVNSFPEMPICMAASRSVQLNKTADQTNRLATKSFFALHKRRRSHAAITSNNFQFCRRISFKKSGMLRPRRIVAFRTGRDFACANALTA
jgi:hypothetical protein